MRELSFSDLQIASGGLNPQAVTLNTALDLVGGFSGTIGYVGTTHLMQMIGIDTTKTVKGGISGAYIGVYAVTPKLNPLTIDFDSNIGFAVIFSGASGAAMGVLGGLFGNNLGARVS